MKQTFFDSFKEFYFECPGHRGSHLVTDGEMLHWSNSNWKKNFTQSVDIMTDNYKIIMAETVL